MRKYFIYALVFVIFSSNTFCQSLKLNKQGVIMFNKPFFKHFAILMQDTTLGNGNRFDSWWDAPKNNKDWQNQKLLTLPAYILDSAVFIKSEEKLLNPDSSVAFYSYPGFPNNNNKLQKDIKNYLRLYIGYIDTSGHTKIVVQFVTQKEFEKMEYIYSKELFLIEHQKKLRFAIIKL